MLSRFLALIFFPVICLAAAIPAQAASFNIFADAADARARDIGPSFDGMGDNASEVTQTTRRVGSFTAASSGIATEDDFLIFPFALPALPSGEQVTSATFGAYFSAQAGAPNFDVSLQGLARTNASPTVLGSDYEANGTLLEASFVSAGDSTGSYYTFSGDELVNFLNDQYGAGAAGDFAFLRLSRSDGGALVGGGIPPNTAFEFRMSEFAGTSSDPFLQFETAAVPEPASIAIWSILGLGLAGFGLYRTRSTRLARAGT